jgi:predicted nucleic acid-binding protein
LRRDDGQGWWTEAVDRDELVTSVAEILRGPAHRQERWIGLLNSLELLDLVPPVRAIEEEYIARRLMPAARDGDALHLAFASYYECDYLATWNYRHLANANKLRVGHNSRRRKQSRAKKNLDAAAS